MFDELKVLELASVLAGPAVSQFFAELGADVIKVENLRTGGDVTRTWKGKNEKTDDRSAYFCSVNWGKRSIAVDLQTEEGKAIVHKLAHASDIVIASYKPGDAEKLGVDYSTLSKVNPGLIYGHITGYGPGNERVGYDAVLQAEAGFMFMNGEPGRPSLKMPVALVDLLAAHQLKQGLLLALIAKGKTGQGSYVAVSLLQAAISSLVNQANNWLMAGSLPEKAGSSHANIAPYGDIFLTADGAEVILAVGNDKQFADLCALLDLADFATYDEYRTNESRVRNRAALNAALAERISKMGTAELNKRLRERKIPAGVVQNLKDVFAMPEAQQVLFDDGALTGLRTFVCEGLPVKEKLLPPPHFGEHTAEILSSIS